MPANRYLNAVLTVIAVELGWMALTHSGVPVSAQQSATPVIITGVQLQRSDVLPIALRSVELDRNAFLPVAMFGQVANPPQPARFRPLDVQTVKPVKIEADRPIRIEADQPLTVRIPVTSSPRPGQ